MGLSRLPDYVQAARFDSLVGRLGEDCKGSQCDVGRLYRALQCPDVYGFGLFERAY